MARPTNLLSDRKIKSLTKPGLHADGGGLYLRISPTGSKAWTFIYQMHGKRRETGFGSLAAVDLTSARAKRDKAKEKVAAGLDPVLPDAAPVGTATFGEEAEALLASLSGSWKNAKHRQQWENTLRGYCKPIWNKDVAAIDTNDVLSILNPIWSKVPETAKRLRGRIERVLDAARVKGFRSGDNPARWGGHLAVILPRGRKKSLVEHHAAMAYEDVSDFWVRLRGRLSMAARCLQFVILTAARTTEALQAKWKEIDLEAGVWTVPAERMKMERPHRVALSTAALDLLRAQAVFGCNPDHYVFPSRKPNQALSNMAMEMLLRRMGLDDVTVHGFRSSFRDWVGEETDHQREIAEAALAHKVGDDVEQAYRRGDALAKRRRLMEDWAEYVTAQVAGEARIAA